MLSLSAAAWAPLRIKAQNESAGTSCVIIATVARGVLALPAPIPPPCSLGLPPVDEQDASKLITAAAAATVAARRGRRRVDESGGQFVNFIAFLVFLWRREGVADGISATSMETVCGVVVSVGTCRPRWPPRRCVRRRAPRCAVRSRDEGSQVGDAG